MTESGNEIDDKLEQFANASFPISVIFDWIETDDNDEQFLKSLSFIIVMFWGKEIDDIFWQFSNEDAPIDVKLLGRETEENPVFLNADFSIEVIESTNVNEVKLVHFLKDCFPINVTFPESETEDNAVQFLNNFSSIFVIDCGIVIDDSLTQFS